MRMLRLTAAIGWALMALAGGAWAAQIEGDYLEVRSADVYTGACVANSEVGLVGNQAIMVWRVGQGSWQGVPLDGLSVVGVVKARTTLGDPFGKPYPARSVLIVDARADARQRQALQGFAKAMGGELLQNVVAVESAPITMEAGAHGAVKMTAGRLARVETRCLHEGDHLCGNEEVYYPPLTKVSDAMPVYTIVDEFRGDGLGVHWRHVDKRSAFVGHFSL